MKTGILKITNSIFLLLVILIIFSCGGKNENTTVGETESAPMEHTASEMNSTQYLDWVVLDKNNSLERIELTKSDAQMSMDSVSLNELERKFEDYKKLYDTIKIEGTTYYIAEGDILFDEDELYAYFKSKDKKLSSGRLVGIIWNGEVSRWPEGYVIKYAIIESTFSDLNNEYDTIKESIRKATEEWSSICNVKFQHIQHYDNALGPDDNPKELTFVVKKINAQGKFIAEAPFPHYSKRRQKLLIDQSYFRTKYNKVGIFRHELGHVLGFLHEHIKSGAPAICREIHNDEVREAVGIPLENLNYDPKSVMHYYCAEGFGTLELAFTNVDRMGAAMVYGPPKP